MLWNHVFILYEVYQSFYYAEYLLFILSSITTILSYYRHFYNERVCNHCEPYFAKGTELYMTTMSVCLFQSSDILILLCLKLFMIFIWKMESYNFEFIHPWLHIVVAMDAHYYLYCYSRILQPWQPHIYELLSE